MNVVDEWVVATPDLIVGMPAEDGWTRIGDWECRTDATPEGFRTCSAVLPGAWGDEVAATCLAAEHHEHPHVACNTRFRTEDGWLWWSAHRIVGVRRTTRPQP